MDNETKVLKIDIKIGAQIISLSPYLLISLTPEQVKDLRNALNDLFPETVKSPLDYCYGANDNERLLF